MIFVSCKKEEETLVLAGEEDEFEIVEHNITLKAVPEGTSLGTEVLELDITGDAFPDLTFTNYADSVSKTLGEFGYQEVRWNRVEVSDSRFAIAETGDSQVIYEGIIDTTSGYYGTFMAVTYYWKWDCSPFEGSNEMSDYPTANVLHARKAIGENLDWEVDYGPFKLSQQAHETATYEPTAGLDSLIGTHLIIGEECNNLYPNVISYLPIRLKEGVNVRYGWIELSIDDEHGLTIHRSALSK